MACTVHFVRIAVEVDVVSGSTTHDDPIANFKSVDSLRVRLEALVAVFDIDGDVVWRAVSERYVGKPGVTGVNSTGIAGALAWVACYCCAIGSLVEACCAVANVWSGHAVEVVGRIIPEEIGHGPYWDNIAFWGRNDGLTRFKGCCQCEGSDGNKG